jgi:hypothetical protein
MPPGTKSFSDAAIPTNVWSVPETYRTPSTCNGVQIGGRHTIRSAKALRMGHSLIALAGFLMIVADTSDQLAHAPHLRVYR